MIRRLALLLVLTGPWLGGAAAEAVIVASGDGTQNTTAPSDDPGFANLGIKGGLSVIYVGNRWVVTAAHVGIGTVTFGGVPYDAIPGTTVSFETAPGQLADLIVFKLREDPGLPALSIATAAPASGTDVVMIGHGRNRGAASGSDGFFWGTGYTMRWGTNRMSGLVNVLIGANLTRSLSTTFTKWPPSQVTPSEAHAAEGDSGGALFVKNGGSWQLAGLLFAIGPGSVVSQPPYTAFYGNVTYAADLSFYRSAILAVTTQPACSDGIEDDGDGLTDFPSDPGCDSANDLDEHSPLLACDDGADNDGDGLADSPADPGCKDPSWVREDPPCDDDLDNDGDGTIDWDGGASNGTPDAYCVANGSWRNTEAPPPCGLGAELAILIPLLARWRRRTHAD